MGVFGGNHCVLSHLRVAPGDANGKVGVMIPTSRGAIQGPEDLPDAGHTQVYDAGDLPDSMGEKESVVTVDFTRANDVTLAATTIEFASKEDRDAALSTGMTDGMEMSYKQMDEILTD